MCEPFDMETEIERVMHYYEDFFREKEFKEKNGKTEDN